MSDAPDRQLLDRLVREHMADLLRLAVRLTGNLDTAEDVLQDALAAIARAWSGFRQTATFRTWATRIVVNAFRDHLRRTERTTAVKTVSLDTETADHRPHQPGHATDQQELGEQIARHVSALPPRQREVLVLIVYEELQVNEVAHMLDITPANVHATLYAARQRLAQELAEYLGVRREV
jgi:RNA polymerase sigma-70 factor (ECF subfamily)